MNRRVHTETAGGPQAPAEDQVHLGDCLELLGQRPAGSVDLIFADPPFNIGYTYDIYADRLEYDRYVEWSRQWMAGCRRVLTPTGSFYVAIGDEFAAEIRTIGRNLGLHLRNWIIWYYTFGQNTKAKFARSHVHIFYFVVDPQRFTFNDRAARIPSARHTEYSDSRADADGKIPDDTWEDFPRVCGTYKERQGWHGCQMPEALLSRIIRVSSNPGELVLDPFSGSGTTVVAAARLGRRFLGFDISAQYIAQTRKRLDQVAAEQAQPPPADGWTPLAEDTLLSLYRETGTVCDRLLPNAVALACFVRCLNARLDCAFSPADVADRLQRLAAANRLPRLRNERPFKTRHGRNDPASDPPPRRRRGPPPGEPLFPLVEP